MASSASKGGTAEKKGKVLFITTGARGDVEPYAAVCLGLLERNYDVLLMTNPEHETLVKDLRIPFKSVEWRFRDVWQTRAVIKGHMTNAYTDIVKAIFAHRKAQAEREYATLYNTVMTWKPDLVLLGPFYNDVRYWLPIVCEVPALLMVTATRHLTHFDNPPLASSLSITDSPLFTLMYWIDKSCMKSALKDNKKTYGDIIANLSGKQVDYFWPTVPQHMGLLGWDESLTWWPVVGAFEREMQENKALLDMPQFTYVGYPMLPPEVCVGEEWGASELNAMEAFLADGPPPVLISWGSMTVCTPRAMTRLAIRSLQLAKCRGIIISGWAGLDAKLLEKDPDIEKISKYCKENILFMKGAPFMSLLPRCSLIVHHGGAGTTMTAMRVGRPQIITPSVYDQYDCGNMVGRTALTGVITGALSELSPEGLCAEIKKVLDDVPIQRRAEDMGENMRYRHYYNHVVDYVENFLIEQVWTGTFMENVTEYAAKNRSRKPKSYIFNIRTVMAFAVFGLLVPFVNLFGMGPRDYWAYYLPRPEGLLASGNDWFNNRTGGKVQNADWMHTLRAKDCNLLKWKPGNSLLKAFQGMAQRAKGTGKPCYFSEDAPDMWVELIRRDKPLTYVRYNEGEWTAIAAIKDNVGDHFCALSYDHMPCPEAMIKRMYVGVSNVTWSIHQPPQGFQFLLQGGSEASHRAHWQVRGAFWVDDALHGIVRNHPAHLEAWAVQVRKHPLLLVGPCSYRRFCHKLPYDRFIEIPPVQHTIPAVMQTILMVKHQVLEWMDDLEENQEERHGIILMSAGLMTKALATDLFPYTKGTHYLIDIGSALDPLIDDPDKQNRRKLMNEDVGEIRQCYTGEKQCPPDNDMADMLTELLPETYGEHTEEELKDVIREWIVSEGEHRTSCQAVCEFDVSGIPLKKNSVWMAQLFSFLIGGSTVFWLFRSFRDDGVVGQSPPKQD
mmetsp:Transcript_52276/g.122388  ORF Transcript_52276/g.122388 Transcript_52276/m.122388 type:complete len:951 (-) Transcript_52276:64-2916(-)